MSTDRMADVQLAGPADTPAARGAAVAGEAGARHRRRVPLLVIVGGLMLLPVVVTIASLAGRPWWPVDDFGVTDVLVRSVWSIHIPQIGFYSRPPWNHPGPLMYWLMGLVSALTGGATWGTRIGGAMIQGLALGWLAWLAWKRGVAAMLAAGAVTAISLHAIGPYNLREPWNPNVAIGVFILFLFLTVFAANGELRLLLAMAAVGSFLVQTHLSYALLVGAAVVWVVGCALFDARRRGRAPDRWRSTALVAIVVAFVCWITPIVEAATHRGGNFRKIVAYFVSSEHKKVGAAKAVRIMAAEFRVRPPWLGGHEPFRPFTGDVLGVAAGWLVVGVAIATVGLVAARMSRSAGAARRVLLAVVLLVAGTVGIASADEPRAYTFGWRVVLAVFLVVVCVWAVAEAVAVHAPKLVRRAGATLVVGAVAWASIALAVSIPSTGRGPLSRREPALRTTMAGLDRVAFPRGPILLRSVGPNLPSLYDGLVDQLSRRGKPVRVDAWRGRVFGAQFVVAPARARAMWYVVERGAYAAALARIPGARVVTRMSPLPPAKEAELERLDDEVWGAVLRTGRTSALDFIDNPFVGFVIGRVPGLDPSAVTRLAQLNREVNRLGTCRCAIVAVPPDPHYPVTGMPAYR